MTTNLTDMNISNELSSEEPLFRPAKRRKFYRKHNADDDDNSVATPISSEHSTAVLCTAGIPADQDDNEVTREGEEETHLTMAEILRRRQAARNRRGGIEFTNSTSSTKSETALTPLTRTTVDKGESAKEIQTVVNRFAPQTGQVADVDKHMMAYIDCELAKRRQGHAGANPHTNGHGSHEGLTLGGVSKDGLPQRQPAALGKLHEIDLGPDATLRNIARTEAAKKRMEAGEGVEKEEGVQKVRLRKDGKPWRGRRRRNSEDVKRDKLVEEVLRESRLEIYDEPDPETAVNDDQAADDRIAEQFRREFLDAISSRRQRSGPTAASKQAKGKPEAPKGPKLGGSRSARAAMRELQEKAAKK